MKKNVLFVLFGATILLTMNACKTDELDLDKELKFSKLSVEEQKASIEQNGLDLVTAMEGMQNTKAMTALMNLLEIEPEYYYAPFQRLVSDIKNGRQKAFSNFDKQMRVSYNDSTVWGEYSYNFTTKEMDKVEELTDKLIINFPATATATTNTAKITITYEESTVEIPDTDNEMYPSKITCVMTVGGSEVMSANFSGKYYADGVPQEATQSLKMDTYEWTAEIKNDKKTASESYEFKNGKTILIKSVAKVNGTLTESALRDAMEDESPEDAITDFAVYAQVMDIAVKGGTTDLKGLMTEMNAIDYEKLSEKQRVEKEAEILNKYMVCTAYFVDANRKFADVEFYTVEYTDEWSYYDEYQQKYIYQSSTYYDIAPRFILSDGSKVAVEDYVQEGFDKLINKIKDMGNDFNFDY